MRALVVSGLATLALIPSLEVSLGQTVHAILVGDTLGDLPGTARNIELISGLLKQLQDEGGVNVVINADVVGDNFGCNAIRKAVQSTKWTRNDTVLFYYAGHGYKDNPEQSKFPGLDCRNSNADVRTDFEGNRGIDLLPGSRYACASPSHCYRRRVQQGDGGG